MTTTDPVIEVAEARVRFGEVRALDDVSLRIGAGECIGLVGHNGAGKSTFVNVINGGLSPQEGRLLTNGTPVPTWTVGVARAAGVRCVFQELSLCPNLTVVENTRLMHRNLGGIGWRIKANGIILRSLDAIFPGHRIEPKETVGGLSIAQRQMVEIAMAFSDAGIAPRVVILDEPTSSLDQGLAAQLLAYVRRFVAGGGTVILISHILGEILSTATRIVVMKDGRIVAEDAAQGFTHDTLVAAMGNAAKPQARGGGPGGQAATILRLDLPRGLPFVARQGEVIGLAGLGGHGQTEMLVSLFERASPAWLPRRDPAATFVAGDRRLNGIFDLWSILRNMTIASLPDMSRLGVVRRGAEADRGAAWTSRIAIRTPDMGHPILSLSGGNQQKVLFARALSTRAPVVLMDDPMRGVDIGTKQEVYGIIRSEAAQGRTFVWYSTEMDEMQLCDRVYVFREGAIVADLVGEAISEHAILSASFRSEAA